MQSDLLDALGLAITFHDTRFDGAEPSVLAAVGVEYISGAPAEQPDTAAPITPDDRTREAARMMWAALSETPSEQ